MQKIIIYLETSDLSSLSWMVTYEVGAPTFTLHGNLAELAELAKANIPETIIIAPPEDVVLTAAKLPKLSRQRLLQALPFALEEQLLTEVSDLHFAMGEYSDDGVPVAIVTKQKISLWLQALKELGFAPTALIPAPLALPLTENNWHIKVYGDSAIVRTGLYSGFACDKHNLNTLIELKLAEKNLPPQAIHLDNYTLDVLTVVARPTLIENAYPPQHFIAELATVATTGTINLLQGIYQVRRKSHSKKIWLGAAYLASAWVACVFLSNLVSLFILHHQTSQLESQIQAIYKQNFPQATSMVDPKSRMLQKLNQLSNQNHNNHLLTWLGYLGKAMGPTSTIKIKQLDYRNNQLALQLAAPSFDSMDSFTQSLTQQGLIVKPQNVATAGNEVAGTLIISEE